MNTRERFDIIEWVGHKNSRWMLHALYWLAALIFYTVFFGDKNIDYKITFSFVIVLLPVTIITTYFLNYELLPNYLFKKRYRKFFLFFTYTIIVSFYIEMVTMMGIFILVAELNMEELHPSNTNALTLIAGMYVVVFLGVAVKLVNHYNQSQVEIQTLKNEKIEAELKFLKAQLHPHFLFNTLNNLYALTLEKSDKASDVVLKLSQLLDYVLYECNAELVPIEKEVKQLQNYIELEKLRYGDRLKVEFDHPKDLTQLAVPPMLLMTLLENSFKHGISKSLNQSWIKMNLVIDDAELIFNISNSKEKSESKPVEGSGGIGLQNLKNRLKLIYGNQYELGIEENETSYTSQLKLKILAL